MRAPRARSLRCGAKPKEPLSYERCRQPRRGGTGGEELRRLRWSSPPGQVEQVPRGGKPPCPPPPPGTQTAGIASAARVQVRGCKGRSPLHKKTISLPLPAGKGGGGDGGKNKAKGRGGRRQRRQATPAGAANARRTNAARGQAPCPPRRVSQRQGQQATAPCAPRRRGRRRQGEPVPRGFSPGAQGTPGIPPHPPFFRPAA